MSDPLSPLAAAGKTLSLLEKLLTIQYRKRRERFTEIIDPLFKEFQLIHGHYTKLLSAYEASLPIKRIGGIPTPKERQAWAEIVRAANESAELTAPIRKTFRLKAADLLSSITQERERRFVYCLLAYFGSTIHTDINNTNFDEHTAVSQTIDQVLSKKVTADAYIKAREQTSIGESIEDLLLETTEYEYPRKYVAATRRWIDEAYVQIGREYQRLKLELIDKAPI